MHPGSVRALGMPSLGIRDLAAATGAIDLVATLAGCATTGDGCLYDGDYCYYVRYRTFCAETGRFPIG